MTRAALDIEKGVCDGCNATLPGWALYKPLKKEPWKDAVCGACLQASVAVAVEVAPELEAKDWESEWGKYLKAERYMKLDSTAWTIQPDSPLSTKCVEAYKAYRSHLHRMTVDNATTASWVWPEMPALEYPAVLTATAKASGLMAK